MNTIMPGNANVCDWIDSSPSLSELDDNELDTGLGQLNCGLKLEDGLDFMNNEPYHSPGHFYRDEMNLPLNSNFNRIPKVEPTSNHSNLDYNQSAQNISPDSQMDIYRDLILHQLTQDFLTISSKLSLPTDPNLWSVEQTNMWVREACDQFNIRTPSNLNISGKEFMVMSQENFVKRIPEGGETLYAQFQLWKTAFESHSSSQQKVHEPCHPNSSVSLINKPWPSSQTDSETAAPASHQNQMHETNLHNNSPLMPNENIHNGYYSNFNQHQMHSQVPVSYQPTMISQQSMNGVYSQMSPFHCNDPANYYVDYANSRTIASPSDSMSSSSSIIDEEAIDSRFMRFGQQRSYENGAQIPYLDMSYDSIPMVNTQNPINANQHQLNAMPTFQNLQGNAAKAYSAPVPYSKNSSGSIHLWHFIRELLDNPKEYSNCVRWVDRSDGTFKIESSHNLAKLWGLRKNRAAMNYDKLSRSLRQYYKKRIIAKPEKKQRLVYKFLPPYNSFTH